MATIALTANNFEQTIAEHDIVVIDFWASWCGPCRTFKPIFEAAAARHEGVAFASCDTEAEQELAAAFGIRSIPTVAVFRDKVLLYSQPGMLPAEALDSLVDQVKGLDMGAVRAEVEKHQKQTATA